MYKKMQIICKSLTMNALGIKEIRKKFNINQYELAELIGVSRRTIANWESGATIPPQWQERLAQVAQKNTIEIGKTVRSNGGDIERNNSNHVDRMLTIIENQNEMFRRSQDEIDRLINIIEMKLGVTEDK